MIRKVSRWLLTAIFLLPFVNPVHVAPATSYHTEWLAFILGLAALVLIGFSSKIRFELELPSFVAPVLLFLLYLLICSVFNRTNLLVFPYILWALSISLFITTLNKRKFLRIVSYLVSFGSLLTAILVFYQWSTGHRTFGFMAQENHTAVYIFIGILSFCFLYNRNKVTSPYLIIACAILGSALLLTGSRSTLFYGIFFLLLLYFTYQISHTTLKILLSLFITTGLLLAYLFRGGIYDTPRIDMWTVALSLFWKAPFFGIGFGQYSMILDGTLANHSHNILLNLLVETGIIGTSILVFAFVSWCKEVRFHGWYTIYPVGILGVIGIHSLLEYPLWYSHWLGVFAILLVLTPSKHDVE